MTLAQARALLGGRPALEAPHEPEQDRAALARLASWAMRFSPLVAPDHDDGLLLDVTGCERLHHGERRMVNAIGNGLEQLGFANRVCCANTVGCAWAVAHFGQPVRAVIAPGEERAALAPLPIDALRVDAETAEALREVNVDLVGQVLEIPRLELAARFGPALLRRIDEAMGDAAEVIEALHDREPIVAERLFDGAVTNVESLLIVTRELIDDVRSALIKQEAGATHVELTATRLDATPIRLRVRLARPSRDAAHLFSLLRPKVETLHMGYGVEQLSLRVMSQKRTPHVQHAEFGSHDRDGSLDRAAGELVDTLTQRLGPERTLRMHAAESHCPERTKVHRPALEATAAAMESAGLVESDRPSRLFTPPEPIEVMAVTPDGPPIWLRWREREHRIVDSIGPERVHSEWWRRGKDGSEGQWRDYYKVQDHAGRWLWIFRAQQAAQWFVHGEWA